MEFDHFADEINNSAPMIWYMTFVIVEDYAAHMCDGTIHHNVDATNGCELFSYLQEQNSEDTIYADIFLSWIDVMEHWELEETHKLFSEEIDFPER